MNGTFHQTMEQKLFSSSSNIDDSINQILHYLFLEERMDINLEIKLPCKLLFISDIDTDLKTIK